MQVTGGSLSLENTHISQNGTANSAFGAFNFLGGATALINYSSIALHPQTKSTTTFKCAAGLGEIVVRNSAVLGLSPMQSAECMPSIKQEMGIVQQAASVNEQTAVFNTWWYDGGIVNGAMVAGANSPLANKATWTPEDPRYDYEGDARPLMGPGFAGADEP